jgi:hypothetical protein
MPPLVAFYLLLQADLAVKTIEEKEAKATPLLYRQATSGPEGTEVPLEDQWTGKARTGTNLIFKYNKMDCVFHFINPLIGQLVDLPLPLLRRGVGRTGGLTKGRQTVWSAIENRLVAGLRLARYGRICNKNLSAERETVRHKAARATASARARAYGNVLIRIRRIDKRTVTIKTRSGEYEKRPEGYYLKTNSTTGTVNIAFESLADEEPGNLNSNVSYCGNWNNKRSKKDLKNTLYFNLKWQIRLK